MTTPEPPKTLSAAMRMALADEAKAHRSKRYVVDMGDWHYPRSDGCHVCFAGSVMAFTLGVDIHKRMSPYRSCSRWSDVFIALDHVRFGNVSCACRSMGIPSGAFSYVAVTPYEKDRLQWRRDMFKIVRMLEQEGA